MRWILTAIASLALAACTAPDRGPRFREYGGTEPRRGVTLTFSNYTNVRTLDPSIGYDENSTYCEHYLFDTLVNWGDHYLLLADYRSYVDTQDRVDALYRDREAWTRKAIHNVAGMGPFSSDRTIAEYAREIWHTTPVRLAVGKAGGG